MIDEKLDAKISRTEKKMAEFNLRMERLNQNYLEILEGLGSAPEELKEYLENPVNFSETQWNALEQERKSFENNLNTQLSLIPNPNQTKKALSEKGMIQQHWLFVR